MGWDETTLAGREIKQSTCAPSSYLHISLQILFKIHYHPFDHCLQRHDKLLWEDLIEHSLKLAALGNSNFLASLLDHMGVCRLNPIQLLSQVI